MPADCSWVIHHNSQSTLFYLVPLIGKTHASIYQIFCFTFPFLEMQLLEHCCWVNLAGRMPHVWVASYIWDSTRCVGVEKGGVSAPLGTGEGCRHMKTAKDLHKVMGISSGSAGAFSELRCSVSSQRSPSLSSCVRSLSLLRRRIDSIPRIYCTHCCKLCPSSASLPSI